MTSDLRHDGSAAVTADASRGWAFDDVEYRHFPSPGGTFRGCVRFSSYSYAVYRGYGTTGERARKRTPDTEADLTLQEARVADLAARGV
jgi:hypothetical protein